MNILFVEVEAIPDGYVVSACVSAPSGFVVTSKVCSTSAEIADFLSSFQGAIS